jgi:hypothetical protein
MRIGDFPSAVFEKCTSFVMKNPGKIALTVAAIWGAFSFARAFKEAQNFIKEPEDKPEEKFQEPKWRPGLSTIQETDEDFAPNPFCRRPMSVSIPSENFLEIRPLQVDLKGVEATNEENEENLAKSPPILSSPKPFCRRQMSVSIPSENFFEIPPLQVDLTGDEAIENIRNEIEKNKWGRRFFGDHLERKAGCLQS